MAGTQLCIQSDALNQPPTTNTVSSIESEKLATYFDAQGRTYLRHGAAHMLPATHSHSLQCSMCACHSLRAYLNDTVGQALAVIVWVSAGWVGKCWRSAV
eukprot:1161693-Pelagomonas_calceolata.AAC.3